MPSRVESSHLSDGNLHQTGMNKFTYACMNRFTHAAKVLECAYNIEGLKLFYLISFGGMEV